MRNFLAYPRWLAAEGGERTSMIHGSFLELFRQIRMFDPERIVVTWDSPSAFRRKLLPTYKLGKDGKRRGAMTEADYENFSGQLKIFREGLAALGVMEVKVEGVEGDDLVALATATTSLRPITISSTDHDFWQLVRDDVQIYDPRTKTCCTAEGFAKFTGFDGPMHHLAFKVIKGDPGDSIPTAIPRLGEEKAKALARKLQLPRPERLSEVVDLVALPLDVEPYRTREVSLALARNFKLVSLHAAVIIQKSVMADVEFPEVPGSWEGFLEFCQLYQLSTVMRAYTETRSALPQGRG
jgi:5'-3' exonuclease